MMNYHPDVPMSPGGVDHFQKYRDRYVGSVSGENLGYFDEYVDPKAKQAAVAGATTRRGLAEALGDVYMKANAAKWRKVYGRDVEQPYREVMPVIGMDAYPLASHWGGADGGLRAGVGHGRDAGHAPGDAPRRGPAVRRHDPHVPLRQLRRLVRRVQLPALRDRETTAR